ncbi:MAG: hypothetical protein A2248_10290 [Candidatus Raymondbacteria bacterium RIFOXYA2_FULL_49_16]|uniref:YbbR domain pair protein n=1 Tax=Candidatus Raymondbacteria bacterium RIFOXYD12_FULL_49_13 TaxID=1817890 RepID=A0A1F7FEW8_UNCRA|nr:MAG: hypothetical protein A2248_10290 [Candidatus Raymondbacteria bacterium RIFOXYA2_FULL_49_16]OGK05235.1 MAG: hypothetical protein A2519_10395 [Candidatus Raymondbacteria bacterium RIFOXYD12_FULL_49_13]OGP43028.1 MAG: hypothetical protein A2324_14975 [Candidatus Raymondbacteria bacterium RIFOXYB2_FULL_49_35]
MNSLLKPFSLRIIALLCALLLWFYVTMEKRYETTLNIPIRMANVPPALTPAGDFPAVAKVLVSATGKRLLMLRYSHVELYVNCSEVRPGPNTFTLARKNVAISGVPDVDVQFVKDPTQLTVPFDAIVRKEVPVIADSKLRCAENRVMIGEPVLIPGSVTLHGPRGNVAKVEALYTRPIEAAPLLGDTSFFVFVLKPEYYGIQVMPNKVKVRVEVETIKKRTIANIPVRLLDGPAGAELSARTVSLVIAGAEKDVDMIKPELVNVFVPYTRFSIEQLDEVEPTVSIIGDVQWSNLDPPRVTLVRK